MTAHPSESKDTMQGIPVSPGIIIGKAHLVDRSRVKILYQYLIDEKLVSGEVERFEKAIRMTEQQLQTLKNKMPENVKEHSFILDSHLMILKDSMLRESTMRRIKEEKINAEWALKKSFHEIRKIFAQIDDEYIRNRIQDVESVSERILRNLSGEAQENLAEIRERVIIVAHDLSPADTTELNISKVMGFITDVGGQTSHTAIMAQALEIPAVVGLESATARISDGDLLIVDGSTGEVVINPDDAEIIRYQERQLQQKKYKSSIARISHLPAETPDGYRISIKANIEFLEEVTAVRDHGAEGIGLYRTEFLYLRSKGLPTEEELFNDYREVAEIMAPEPVTIRTLDLGGDKFTSDLQIANEMNPAMGLRAIRLCLREPAIFKSQLRAILRASTFGRVQLMFPMISGLQEVLQAKEMLSTIRKELDSEGLLYDENMPVGVMIEIPSAVTISDLLSRHVDFFSIGTNDLIQYALAIDRVNEHVAYMYQPFHPAILRMIQQTVQEGKKAGIKVSLCGEMAGDPLCIPILLALGLDELSMTARSIPLVKNIVRAIPLAQAQQDLERVIQLSTAKEVRDYLLTRMKKMIPELGEKGFFPA
ncbi:MAG: phosphoenolpyruvate--protein phosphotransferase [Deltaproteobacteria bacterium]|nr:MAG: phosphoenolpyruvate--protein phosphotransferase [Deltaproteobacteria bacterium]